MIYGKYILKMSSSTFHSLLIITLAFTISCSTGTEPQLKSIPSIEPKDLVPANRYLVKKNQQNIVNFIHRKNWDMKETQTGLWYSIYEHGKGVKGEKGKTISLKYTVSLLDGSKCYSSDSLGLKTFKIGNGHVESGLEEAVLLLHVGDKARLIIPPHLAYGLPGDNNRIPPQSTVIYDLSVVEIK